MKIELKPNIFIEGFDTEYQYRQRLYGNSGISNSIELLYQGKTSKMIEKLTEESIQSACNQEYCIIYKTK
jgi:hypothetical protein